MYDFDYRISQPAGQAYGDSVMKLPLISDWAQRILAGAGKRLELSGGLGRGDQWNS